MGLGHRMEYKYFYDNGDFQMENKPMRSKH